MPLSRLEMIKFIHNEMPSSIEKLAELLGKDLKHVFKEVKILESMGIISLLGSNGIDEETLRPIAVYDRIILDFDLAFKKASNQ